jgi:hypothetical protein
MLKMLISGKILLNKMFSRVQIYFNLVYFRKLKTKLKMEINCNKLNKINPIIKTKIINHTITNNSKIKIISNTHNNNLNKTNRLLQNKFLKPI